MNIAAVVSARKGGALSFAPALDGGPRDRRRERKLWVFRVHASMLLAAAAMIGTPTGARAAELAVAPVATAPAPLWSWAGLYAGIHFANGWANDAWQGGGGLLAAPQLTPFPGAGFGNGPVAGGQIGWNYQIGPWVLGAETAFGAADINTLSRCGVGLFNCTTNIDYLGTLTGRIGFTFDQFLIYGKGGAAVQRAHFGMIPLPRDGIPNVFGGAATQWGWEAGGGVEFAFSPALSAFAEYDFFDFGSRGISLVDQNGISAGTIKSQSVQLLKIGLNYRVGETLAPWTAGLAALPAWPTPTAASFNWTGVYVGGQVGGGWGRTNWNSSTGFLGSNATDVFAGTATANGFAIGGQVGANYQIGALVTGVEADIAWADLDSNVVCSTPQMGFNFTCHTRIDTLGTLTGRLGFAVGNLLIYGKGGAAWDNERHQAAPGTIPAIFIFSGNDTRWGWATGVGLEYALAPAWTGTVEYDYLNFANKTVALSDGLGNTSNVGLSQGVNIVKVGVNYKLGTDPLASFPVPSAIPMWVKAPVLRAPPSDWSIQAGARYWVSSSRKQYDLLDDDIPTQINSRLTFQDLTTQAAEGFARLEHRDGMFLKGNFGLGDIAKGQLNDEDFPLSLYSDTVSSQRDGRTLYGSLDVGHALIAGPAGDVGAYVGYRYLYERFNAFGLKQLATNPLPIIPNSQLLVSETEAWSGAAIGLNARANLTDRWRLEVDAALLPFVGMWGADNHWFRASINPFPSQGLGWGSQFEAIIEYAVTDQWSVGAGARYWYFATSTAHTEFPGAPHNSAMRFDSERFGGFLQASYTFNGPSRNFGSTSNQYKGPPAPVMWTGLYVGGHLGVGFGRSAWSDPFGPTSVGDQDQVGGALAGSQVGVNYQAGMIVYGVEAAGSWAQLTGTATCFAGNPDQGIAGQDCGTRVGGLAMLTGRVGYALDRTLYYAKAGPAWGATTFDLNFTSAAPGQIASSAADRWGWTIGGGIEQALTGQWSIVGEYKYVDLGNASVSFAGVPAALAQVGTTAINQHYQMLTVGVNYKLY